MKLTPETLGEAMLLRLRDVREARGWTQEELAAYAGVPQAAISRFEAGRNAATVENFLRICSALGFAIDDAYYAEAHKWPKGPAEP
jgi:transcriptional regulator with XRE-family HTH domain